MAKNKEQKEESEEAVASEEIQNGAEVEKTVTQKQKSVRGLVGNCGELRVREAPNAKSKELKRLKCGEIVYIALSDSTESFYAVEKDKTVFGFCMKQYIELI